ncbi:MAG: hypothetical protein DRK00_02045 [Thermoprotei archaeon]|nr:MAG: hypothetical protein DRK00_02045 [Thermoprotei archaeon]
MRLRHAIVGAGVIGRHHAKVVHELEEYELVAVADVVEEKARSLAERYGARAYTDYVEMFEKEELDTVSVCTPHPLHSEVAVAAAKHGVNVLTEKPMAATVSQCLEMIWEARRRGVKLGVVFQYRFEPHFRRAKRLISSGGLGEPYRALLRYVTYRDMAYYGSAEWRGRWASEGGGVLINQAVHLIDAFTWLMGMMPVEVFAYAGTVGHDIEVEDLVSAVALYANGCQAAMQFSTLDTPDMVHVEIRGDRGVLLVETSPKRGEEGLKSVVGRYLYLNETPIRRAIFASLKGGGRPGYRIEEVRVDEPFTGHRAVLEDFAKAVLEDREPEVPGEEGVKSVELINAMIMSAVKGQPVKIPISPAEYDRLLEELKALGKPPWRAPLAR